MGQKPLHVTNHLTVHLHSSRDGDIYVREVSTKEVSPMFVKSLGALSQGCKRKEPIMDMWKPYSPKVVALVVIFVISAVTATGWGFSYAQEPVIEETAVTQASVGTGFTYQGRLTDLAGPVNGTCDFRFKLWTAATGGEQAGVTVEKTSVVLTNGYFTVDLDFGMGIFSGPDTFTGEARWLSVEVRCPAGSGTYTTLNGRVALNPAPYALSLRPGSVIKGSESRSTLSVQNTTAGEWGAGLLVETRASKGTAVIARARSDSMEKTYGVYATIASRGGAAVYGESTHGSSLTDNEAYGGYFKANAYGDTGVYAESAWTQGSGIGLEAKSAAPYGYGVKAVATASGDGAGGPATAIGVYGSSEAPRGYGGYFEDRRHVGVYARGSDADIELGSDRGRIVAAGQSDANMTLVSNDSVYVYLDDNNDQSTISAFYILDGSDRLTPIFEIDDNGNTYIYGNLQVTGSKNNVVNTAHHGQRLLYAVESPENWFEDFGSAELHEGEAVVPIEPIFAETVNLNRPYHVFLTPLGDCALYVAEKTPTQFTVRAIGGQRCSIAFDYRLVAKRMGYEDVRLEATK